MKLGLSDIINKHKGVPCVVALHGPSLNPFVDQIQELQKNKNYLRISVNEWYDFFNLNPDYWVVSNTEFTIKNSIFPNEAWDNYFQWPKDVFNQKNIPLLFNETADLTPEDFVGKYLKCDYLPYDAKHFKNHNCREILNNFRQYYEKHENFAFKTYGNNEEMWKPLSLEGTNCHPSWAAFASAWARDNKCCHKIKSERKTLQETLQDVSGHSQHMGPGVSVAFHSLVFAILMGCNPVYVGGLDLEMAKGYAKSITNGRQVINQGAIGHWKVIFNKIIQNDLRILKESADLLGTEIINLNTNAWYDTLPVGNLI